MKPKDKYQYYTLSKKELRKQRVVKILPIVLTILFGLAGLTLGIVGLLLNGWDFKAFITDPIWALGFMLAIIAFIVALGFVIFKKGNSDFNGK